MTAAITASAARRRRRPHHVVMLAYPDVQILDVTGPLEVFSRAARWMQDHGLRRDLAYRVEVVAPRGASSGRPICPSSRSPGAADSGLRRACAAASSPRSE